MPSDLTSLSASALSVLLRTGKVTVETAARAYLDRIATRDVDVRAWSYIDPAHAIAQARELDRRGPGRSAGALFGLPVGIKDIMLTHDMPTQYNSSLYRGFHPRIDAACVAILRSADALIMGKTDTVEFAATGRPALTRNPHDMARTPGGSSSGSAAAVADSHVPLALGTQTGGSMIRPASYCGVFGMKPTWGLVSRDGAKMFALSLDTIGWYGRTAEDLRLLYDVFDPEPASEAEAANPILDLRRARIASYRSPSWADASAATRHAFAQAEDRLEAAGARVERLLLPPAFDELVALQRIVMLGEGRSAFLPEYRQYAHHGTALHESFRDQVDNTFAFSRADLCRAYDIAAQCRMQFDAATAAYDAVLTPSTAGAAPLGLTNTGGYSFNAMWSLLHVPCVNVPGFVSPDGMPVGLTVTGPRFADRRVLAAAAAMEPLFNDAEP